MNFDPLSQFYNQTLTEASAAVIVFNILFAFILSMAIVWVWRHTHRGLSYSQSFAITIVLLGPLSTAVMMVVRNNLIGAFALLGAFSLIRFRTIMKETRDIAFLFFSLTVGVAVGTNSYAIALLTTIIISLITLVLYRYNFGSHQKSGSLLTFEANESFQENSIENLFKKYVKDPELIHVKSAKEGREYSYTIHFGDPSKTTAFMNELRSTPGIQNSFLLSGKATIEY